MSCPICNAKPAKEYRPFCSRRCADLDLARWVNGNYAIPSEDPDDLEEAAQALDAAPPEPPSTRRH